MPDGHGISSIESKVRPQHISWTMPGKSPFDGIAAELTDLSNFRGSLHSHREANGMSVLESRFLTKLASLLAQEFNPQELRAFASGLGIAYNELIGETKDEQVRALVRTIMHQGRLSRLIDSARLCRPCADWPTVSESFTTEAYEDRQQAERTHSTDGVGPTFNLNGDIEASQIQIGGIQTYQGQVSIDMSKTTITQPEREIYMGDKIEMSGDFRGAIVNVRSRLENVTQTIQLVPLVDSEQKRELIDLIDELKEELTKIPEDRAQDSEKVAKRVEALIREVEEKEPDKEMVQITGESLKRAAKNLVDVMPTVLMIATQIVGVVLKTFI